MIHSSCWVWTLTSGIHILNMIPRIMVTNQTTSFTLIFLMTERLRMILKTLIITHSQILQSTSPIQRIKTNTNQASTKNMSKNGLMLGMHSKKGTEEGINRNQLVSKIEEWVSKHQKVEAGKVLHLKGKVLELVDKVWGNTETITIDLVLGTKDRVLLRIDQTLKLIIGRASPQKKDQVSTQSKDQASEM